jgi:hypothetical protein
MGILNILILLIFEFLFQKKIIQVWKEATIKYKILLFLCRKIFTKVREVIDTITNRTMWVYACVASTKIHKTFCAYLNNCHLNFSSPRQLSTVYSEPIDYYPQIFSSPPPYPSSNLNFLLLDTSQF